MGGSQGGLRELDRMRVGHIAETASGANAPYTFIMCVHHVLLSSCRTYLLQLDLSINAKSEMADDVQRCRVAVPTCLICNKLGL